MASKRRLRRKTCDSKRNYDKDAAHAAARRKRKSTGEYIVAYKCQFGSHWHIGHAPKQLRQSMATKRGE